MTVVNSAMWKNFPGFFVDDNGPFPTFFFIKRSVFGKPVIVWFSSLSLNMEINPDAFFWQNGVLKYKYGFGRTASIRSNEDRFRKWSATEKKLKAAQEKQKKKDIWEAEKTAKEAKFLKFCDDFKKLDDLLKFFENLEKNSFFGEQSVKQTSTTFEYGSSTYTIEDAMALLDVEDGFTQKDLVEAFRKLAMEHHPDKGGDTEMFKKIHHFFEVLKTF